MSHPVLISVIGNTFTMTAMVLRGPLPFIQLEPTLSTIQSVYAGYPVGFALLRVSTLVRSQRAITESGFIDNEVNNSFVAGQLLLQSF